MIVIEGMDNSGKSTLARKLADYFGYDIQESEGPPKSAEEINERVDRYSRLTNVVFVRHPVSSNAIYGQMREEGDPITYGRSMTFYESRPLIIYCDAGERGLGGHVIKESDTPEHLEKLKDNYHKLLGLYRIWAAQHAHFTYRIGDDMDQLIATVYFYYMYQQGE